MINNTYYNTVSGVGCSPDVKVCLMHGDSEGKSLSIEYLHSIQSKTSTSYTVFDIMHTQYIFVCVQI